jgi:hypothetical protein
MSTNSFLIGETVRLTLALADLSGTAADPGALRLKTKSPAGATTTTAYGGGTLLKDSVGNYHIDLTPASTGLWFYRWEADAPNAGAAEGSFNVMASKVI